MLLSSSLQPHGLQHSRLPCPSLSPRVCLNSCLLSRWCHPTISSSVDPFSSCPQSFPASGSFPMSQLFTSGGQSIGASALASVHARNIQGWFPLGWTGLISLLSKGFSRVFSNTTVQRHQLFSTLPHICTWLLSLHRAPTGSQFMVILIQNCSSITDKLAVDTCSRYSMNYFKISY